MYMKPCTLCNVHGLYSIYTKLQIHDLLTLTTDLKNLHKKTKNKTLFSTSYLHSDRDCYTAWYCNGMIQCPWRTPNDEEGCGECPPELPNRCTCNTLERNYACKSSGKWNLYTCYQDHSK